MVYTRKQLSDMKQDELVDKFLTLQTLSDASIDKLSKEIQELKNHFQQQFNDLNNTMKEKMSELRSEIQVAKNTSYLLEKRCISLEQYSRRECLEVRGVPVDIHNDNLLEYLKPIFKEIECPISDPHEIQACHRLNNRNNDVILSLLIEIKEMRCL